MLENPRAPRIRAIAQLARRSARQEQGRFLIEGPQALGEALAWRSELLVEAYATPDAATRHPRLIDDLERAGIDVHPVTERVLAAMADTVRPQGIVAVCRTFTTTLAELVAARPQLVAILHEVRDPGNAGTVIRAADAAGAAGVVLAGDSVDHFNPKVVRSTTGSLFHLPVVADVELTDVIAAMREAGLTVLAADIKGDDLLAARRAGVLAAPTAWLFGNEAHGLTDEALDLVDRSITVPIYGRAESMNLATAASVCLFESAFEQQP